MYYYVKMYTLLLKDVYITVYGIMAVTVMLLYTVICTAYGKVYICTHVYIHTIHSNLFYIE